MTQSSVEIPEQPRQMRICELGPFGDLTLLLLGLSLGLNPVDLGSCSSFGSIGHGLVAILLEFLFYIKHITW